MMLNQTSKRLFVGFALVTGFLGACGRSGSREGAEPSAPESGTAPVLFNKNDYPVFVNPDSGADPSVSAEQGGRGFTGQDWETNTDFDLIGDPRAAKGGMLRDYLLDFPGTLRIDGPESNSQFNYGVTSMVYESLLSLHTTTQEHIPTLATHWQISPDKLTYRYRIDPNARFSDGQPVTAQDVVATYDFMMDKTLQSPSNQLTFGKLERPVAESKYIVRVRAKELNWRNFLYFSGMAILPAHVLKEVNGERYLKEYNFKLLPGSGGYMIREEDVDKGNSITVRRRKDHWAGNARSGVGLGNFDELRFVVVRDPNLAFEMFKKGDLDYYFVNRAKQWVEETDFDNVRRGLIQKRKVFNNEPQGFQGFAMNTRRPPFNDIRVRKALTLMANRKLMIEKLAYNEYLPLNSYHPGTVYENPNNPKNEYDPQAALALLAEAGWKSRDSRGRLTREGQPLEFELQYTSKTFEPHLTVYQEDLRKVGITVNLRLINPETQFQMINERRFQMSLQAWGALLFPNPETMLHSKMADVNNTNNITGFKNARVDALCNEYDVTFDLDQRVRMIQEIDGLVANDYQYVLLWYGPYSRVLYWNKFGTPPGYLSRTGDYFGSGTGPGIPQMWWIDASKETRLRQALGDPSIKLEVGPLEDRYWLEFSQRQKNAEQAPKAQ